MPQLMMAILGSIMVTNQALLMFSFDTINEHRTVVHHFHLQLDHRPKSL